MSDQFSLLDDCRDQLGMATLVDRVSFHRFVGLTVPAKGDGGSRPAVFPPDYAVPDLVLEAAVHGWPPRDLEAFRGGLPLVDDWAEPAEECGTRPPLVKVEVSDLDEFLSNPRVQINGAATALALTPENVTALLGGGSTYVRRDDGPGVLVRTSPTALPGDGGAQEVVIPDLGSVVAGDIGDMLRERGVRLSSGNVRELRERGETWLRAAGDGPPVRAVIRDLVPVAAAHVVTNGRTPAPLMRSTAAMARTAVTTTTAADVVPSYAVPAFEFVLYLPYRQDWTLVGFARGDLLNSIALAPQEEISLEVSSWDRNRWSSDVTEESGWESSLEAGSTNRLTRDLVNDVTRNEAWKLTGAGVQVGVPQYVDVGVNMSGDFGTTLQAVNRGTLSRIDEATTKAAFRARGLRQTKVSQTREWGFEERSTRKLRNPNTCRTVTYDAFEVVGAYDVKTYPVPEQIRLAVLVPSPIVMRFDRASIITHEGVLRRALLDPTQAAGFDAARWLAARDEHCALSKESPCRPAAQQQTPPAAAPATTTAPGGVDPVQAARDRALAAGDRIVETIRKISAATHRVASAYDAGVRGAALEEVILEYRQWLFRVFGLEKWQPGFWGACLRFEREYKGTGRNPERVEQLLNETGGAWAESVGRVAIAVLVFGQWTLAALAVELVIHLGLKVGWYAQYTARGFDDAGLGAQLTTARTETEGWRKALSMQSTAAAPARPDETATPSASSPTGITDTAAAAPAAQAFSDEDTARHRVAERALMAHLEGNRSHYTEAVWHAVTAADRTRLIDAAVGKLSTDITPELLGFFGDRIAVPFRADRYASLRKAMDDIADQITGVGDGQIQRVVLPTPGVHLQPRVGECDAAEEFVLRHRALDIADKEAAVRRAVAEADSAEHEAARREARLSAQPPDLEDPDPDPALVVRIDGRPPQS